MLPSNKPTWFDVIVDEILRHNTHDAIKNETMWILVKMHDYYRTPLPREFPFDGRTEAWFMLRNLLDCPKVQKHEIALNAMREIYSENINLQCPSGGDDYVM